MSSSYSTCTHNSSYFDALNVEVKKCYDVNMSAFGTLGNLFATQKKSLTSLEWDKWPSLENPDKYDYL